MSFYFGVANYIVHKGEIRKDFYPYFYVIGEGTPPKLPGVRSVEKTDFEPWEFDGLTYSPRRGKVYRVYADVPALVPQLREKYWKYGFKTSQSNVPYGYRASADLDGGAIPQDIGEALKNALSVREKILAFDVEVVGDRLYIGYTVGDDVVITSDPYDLAVEDVDAFVGFNSWSFDVKYLKPLAATEFAFETPWGVKPHIDLFIIADSRAASAFGKVESGSSLYEVALQVGALPEGMGVREVMRHKLRRAQLHKLSEREIKEYLALDVKITYLLGLKWYRLLKAIGTILGVSPMAQVQLLDKGTTALMAEVAYYKELERIGRVYVERSRELEFEGGDKTKSTAPGVYENVAEYDFSAMYPTTYTLYRVGPDNIYECGNGFEVVFTGGLRRKICFGDDSPVWRVMKRFFESRQATKKLKDVFPEADQAVKILANSAYGGFARTAGIGIVNEYAAAFIFQFTERIFESLWEWLKQSGAEPIYGDTDSVYIKAGVNAPLNEYVKKFGELYEMKLEGIWKKMVLLTKKDGGVAEKSYIKTDGERVVIKGGKLKPHDLPRGLRFYAWRDIVKQWLDGVADLDKLLTQWVASAPYEEIFVEKSSSLRDIFRNNEGKYKSRLHHMSDIPILATLALRYGGEVLVSENSITAGRKTERVPSTMILDSLFIPVETKEGKQYIIYIDGRSYKVDVKLAYGKKEDTYAAHVIVSSREVGEYSARQYALKYVLRHNAVESLKSLKKIGILDRFV